MRPQARRQSECHRLSARRGHRLRSARLARIVTTPRRGSPSSRAPHRHIPLPRPPSRPGLGGSRSRPPFLEHSRDQQTPTKLVEPRTSMGHRESSSWSDREEVQTVESGLSLCQQRLCELRLGPEARRHRLLAQGCAAPGSAPRVASGTPSRDAGLCATEGSVETGTYGDL
jgi:hypothetical protein